MKPYYQDDACMILHADCREVLPTLTADAVVSDPPYGVNFEYDEHRDDEAGWFDLMDTVVPMARSVAPFVVFQSCAINRMGWWYANHPPDWLIAWHKGSPGHVAKIGFNDWEPVLAWGRPHRPMHDFFSTRCGFSENINGHPCPKPIEWAYWLIDRAVGPGGTVVDPFVGSGTTLRAAKDHGRKAIGIEMSERYCEIAATRLGQEVLELAC
jgi:site-specific DNA-methyltransferase (adenine-specific)